MNPQVVSTGAGSDGKTHKIYYDEKEMEWFYMVED